MATQTDAIISFLLIGLQAGKNGLSGYNAYLDKKEAGLKRAAALEILTQNKLALAQRYGVTRLALFGSTARDAARDESDVDILVAFDGPATSERYFGVQFYLEDLLGCPVDLVTEKALRPELRPFIEEEAVHV